MTKWGFHPMVILWSWSCFGVISVLSRGYLGLGGVAPRVRPKAIYYRGI